MQVVPELFTAESKTMTRSVVGDFLASWKAFSTLGNRTFTIGVSMIGGNDLIGVNPGAIGSPGIYKYYDESQYVNGMAWERGLNMPIGGLAKAFAEVELTNPNNRFTPEYMGGNEELFTSVYLPRRPIIINAGFNYGGIDQIIPQFAGLTNKPADISYRGRDVQLKAADYIDFFQNKYLDQEVMFTSLRTDEVLENLFQGTLGMSTAQYELDMGINFIPFGLFPSGTQMAGIVDQLVQAENGHLYQDEEGKFRFENRQHWDSSPHNAVQQIIPTSQVIDAISPNDDHLINVVEINAPIYQKQPSQTVFALPALETIPIEAGESIEKFFEFQDPVLQLTTPAAGGTDSFVVANANEDESGTDLSSNITITNLGTFSRSVKFRFRNTGATKAYITQFVLSGRVAKHVSDLYYREQDDSSVTAYQERIYSLNNPYIQNETWAQSLAKMITADFSEIENIQRIVIMAMPQLQLGDLISWQGRTWRIFNIKTNLDPSVGFTQELTLLKRDITTYFRIGISTIGGDDRIAP